MRKTYYLLRPSLTIIQIITGEERGLRGLREVGNFVVIVTLSLLVAIQVISAELPSTSCAMNRLGLMTEQWEQSGNSFLVLVKCSECEGDMYQPAAYLPALMAQKN